MAVNLNDATVAQHRGPIRVCEYCANATLPPPLKTFCRFCQGNGYVAHCLNCAGKGRTGAGTPWDGGRSIQEATCPACGGLGVLASRKREFDEQEAHRKVVEDRPDPSFVSSAVAKEARQ